MKRLITIILALVLNLITVPQKGAEAPPVTAVKPPQTAITTSVEQVPEESETIAERQMEALKDQTNGAEHFVAIARKYTHITEPAPEILNTMIDKIIIGERESKHAKKAVKQKIRILFKGFGELDDLMCV